MTEKTYTKLRPILTDEDAEAAMDDDLSAADLSEFRPWGEFAKPHELDEEGGLHVPPRLARRVVRAAAIAGVTPGVFLLDAVERALDAPFPGAAEEAPAKPEKELADAD